MIVLQSRTSQQGADAGRVWALAAYKDFLALRKDADPGVPPPGDVCALLS
jgi:hypothetical protein